MYVWVLTFYSTYVSGSPTCKSLVSVKICKIFCDILNHIFPFQTYK
jgi:hypothetical protein